MVIDETEQNNFQLTDTSIFLWLRIWKCKLFNPQEGVTSELTDCFCQFFSYHPSNMNKMKVYVTWEHSSFKNVELVAIQSFDPQAQVLYWQIFGKL